MNKETKPKILLIDIETSPLLAYVWGLFDQNVGLNQIHTEWTILSWSAKWLDEPANKIMYQDKRKSKNIEEDATILKQIWDLLDEADIVIGQNSKRFDVKKLNALFLLHEMGKPSSFRQIDTLEIVKRHFALTSNKLEWMTDKLCTKYKKLKHKKYPGFEMWKECLSGNQDAWKCMEKYNKYDVLALEELYHVLKKWDNTINFDVYHDSEVSICKCGNKKFQKNGFFYSNAGRYQRYKCTKCGSETRDKTNLLNKDKKKSLRVATLR